MGGIKELLVKIGLKLSLAQLIITNVSLPEEVWEGHRHFKCSVSDMLRPINQSWTVAILDLDGFLTLWILKRNSTCKSHAIAKTCPRIFHMQSYTLVQKPSRVSIFTGWLKGRLAPTSTTLWVHLHARAPYSTWKLHAKLTCTNLERWSAWMSLFLSGIALENYILSSCFDSTGAWGLCVDCTSASRAKKLLWLPSSGLTFLTLTNWKRRFVHNVLCTNLVTLFPPHNTWGALSPRFHERACWARTNETRSEWGSALPDLPKRWSNEFSQALVSFIAVTSSCIALSLQQLFDEKHLWDVRELWGSHMSDNTWFLFWPIFVLTLTWQRTKYNNAKCASRQLHSIRWGIEVAYQIHDKGVFRARSLWLEARFLYQDHIRVSALWR